MSEFLGSVWWLLVALGVLVTFHEYGHFWVARRCGVKVLRFSVGFGKPLWSRRGRDGTEYVIAAIPLGGYVRMLDENEGDVATADLPRAFNRKPVWQRIAIAAAGPLANLLLAFALLWAMLIVGRPDYAPVVGHVEGIAAQAGLHAGDKIMAVGNRQTPTWSELGIALSIAAIDRKPVNLVVSQADGGQTTHVLALQDLPAREDANPLSDIGLIPRHLLVPAVVGSIRQGSPAWGVLAEGDRITAIDGTPVASYEDISPLVEQLGQRGGKAMIEVERDGERLALELAPKRITDETGKTRWILGITSAPATEAPHDAVLRLGPMAAIPAAAHETWFQGVQIVEMIGRAIRGQVAVQQTVSGPITIARAANDFAARGPAWFLEFLALLSVSLGLLNLLPIPVLDGGHLLYYLIELAAGRPLGERAQAMGQYIGLALIAGLMGLAFYNDILNMMS